MLKDYAKQEWLNQPIIIDFDKWQKRLDFACAVITVIGLGFIGAYIWMHYMGIRP